MSVYEHNPNSRQPAHLSQQRKKVPFMDVSKRWSSFLLKPTAKNDSATNRTQYRQIPSKDPEINTVQPSQYTVKPYQQPQQQTQGSTYTSQPAMDRVIHRKKSEANLRDKGKERWNSNNGHTNMKYSTSSDNNKLTNREIKDMMVSRLYELADMLNDIVLDETTTTTKLTPSKSDTISSASYNRNNQLGSRQQRHHHNGHSTNSNNRQRVYHPDNDEDYCDDDDYYDRPTQYEYYYGYPPYNNQLWRRKSFSNLQRRQYDHRTNYQYDPSFYYNDRV